ncbi:MAG: hypothetical protein AB7Q37_00720 [Pyrinomonadaceae bacterium]
MKKYISSFVMAAMVAVMIPFMATTTNAQSRCWTNEYGQRICRTERRDRRDRGNIYDRHRNLINIGIGTAAGAIIGGLIGGKKGALIGTAAGAGGAALYTYKLNPKTKKYERVYRNNRRY